jgi:hypothetical protein
VPLSLPVAAAIVGFTIPAHTDVRPHLTFLNPRTLQRVADTPRLARNAIAVELSPDQKGMAVLRSDRIELRSAGGRLRYQWISPHYPSPTATWIRPHRLLTSQCVAGGEDIGNDCTRSVLRAIDPRRGHVLRTRHLDGPVISTTRVGRRLIVHLKSALLVVDAGGRARHRVAVPEQESFHGLTRTVLVEGQRVYAIDPESGRLRLRVFDEEAVAVQPSPRGLVLLHVGRRYVGVDPVTLKTKLAPFSIAGSGLFAGAGRGFFELQPDAVVAYRANGTPRRTFPGRATTAGAIGRYLYVQSFSPDYTTYELRVFRLSDGRLVMRRDRRMYLSALLRGRYVTQTPQSNGYEVNFG